MLDDEKRVACTTRGLAASTFDKSILVVVWSLGNIWGANYIRRPTTQWSCWRNTHRKRRRLIVLGKRVYRFGRLRPQSINMRGGVTTCWIEFHAHRFNARKTESPAYPKVERKKRWQTIDSFWIITILSTYSGVLAWFREVSCKPNTDIGYLAEIAAYYVK